MSGLGTRVVEVLCRSREGDGRGDGSRQELLICFGLHLSSAYLLPRGYVNGCVSYLSLTLTSQGSGRCL